VEIGATEKIANFIIETDYEHIPREAIAIAKNAILDYLGVTVAGSNEPVVARLKEGILGQLPSKRRVVGSNPSRDATGIGHHMVLTKS